MKQSSLESLMKTRRQAEAFAAPAFSSAIFDAMSLPQSLVSAAAAIDTGWSLSSVFENNSALQEAIQNTSFKQMMAAASTSPGAIAMGDLLQRYPAAASQVGMLWRGIDSTIFNAPDIPGALWRRGMGSLLDAAVENLRRKNDAEARALEADLALLQGDESIDAETLLKKLFALLPRLLALANKFADHPITKLVGAVSAIVGLLILVLPDHSLTAKDLEERILEHERKVGVHIKAAPAPNCITRCPSPVMLNPWTRSIVIRRLPRDFEVVVLRSAGKWAEVAYLSPEDDLPENGWVMKKYLLKK